MKIEQLLKNVQGTESCQQGCRLFEKSDAPEERSTRYPKSGLFEPPLMAVRRTLRYLLVAFLLVAGAGGLAQGQKVLRNLEKLSLEELLNTKISLVSRQEQSQFEVPAAAYVITQEDIRRSGATSIPEVLRMVPGLQVARLSANKWAISSRGFNGQYSDKMLVLIDGRSVYTPLYGGLYWDVQDVLLEDIDRIEVVRGPGAALWGANAVNGIINIITKSAEDRERKNAASAPSDTAERWARKPPIGPNSSTSIGMGSLTLPGTPPTTTGKCSAGVSGWIGQSRSATR